MQSLLKLSAGLDGFLTFMCRHGKMDWPAAGKKRSVMMSLLALSLMTERGYDPRMSTGAIAASGTLGILIPASIMLVIMAFSEIAMWLPRVLLD